jgi:N-acetylmuramoyl-L-alanine amidase
MRLDLVQNKWIIAFFLLVTLSFRFALAADHLTVKFLQGTLPPSEITLLRAGSTLYLDVNGFAQALNLPTYLNAERGKLQFASGATRLKWTANNPFVVMGQEVRQLPAEVLLKEGRFWAPMEAFIDLLSPTYPAKISVDRKSLTVSISPYKSDLYGIIYEPKDNGTLVRLLCTHKLNFSPPTMRDNSLNLTLPGVNPDVEALKKISPSGAVENLSITPQSGSCQLAFKLGTPVLQQSSWQENDTHQIILSLVTKIVGSTVETTADSRDVDFGEISDALAQDQAKWNLDCIIIDPGHGGKDPGAIGATGLQEKEVTLDIALRLKTMLDKVTGLNVIMTRKEDRFIGLHERTKMANQKSGKLFISIHCNALPNGTGTGFTTFFLKPARNENAMQTALRENAVIKYEESSHEYQELNDENYILLAMAQSEFARESESLAGIVQNQMRMNTGLKDRGVDQAGFYVLVNASMPAILVETAFLSTKREEKLLRTKKFRQQVAEALYDSIVEFQRQTKPTPSDATYMR